MAHLDPSDAPPLKVLMILLNYPGTSSSFSVVLEDIYMMVDIILTCELTIV